MKKILVVCVALMLPCLLVHAQEADNTEESGIVFNVIPRLDLNQTISTVKGGHNELNLGSSSLYTLFEGDLSDNFSFSICNHWLARSPRVKDLYKNTGHSDDVNWVDWAYLTYSTGKWNFTAGKQVVAFGGFESDAYDHESHAILNTLMWNDMAVYQWGAKIGYDLAENTSLALQMTTSPYGEKFFKSGLYSYALEWRGTYGNFETISSFTMFQTRKTGNGAKFKDCFDKYVSFGGKLNLDPVVLTLDVMQDVESDICSVTPSVMWSAMDNLDVLVKGTYNKFDAEQGESDNFCTIGGGVHWYPLKENKDLRIHLVGAYNSLVESATVSVGVLYNLSLKVK